MADRQESRTYDVVIVGMGPGGASAASALSRGGLSVLGFDKESASSLQGLRGRPDRHASPSCWIPGFSRWLSMR